jgi:hypothetical protein
MRHILKYILGGFLSTFFFCSFSQNPVPCSSQQIVYISEDCKTLIYYSDSLGKKETDLFMCTLTENNSYTLPRKIIFNNYAVTTLKKLGNESIDFYFCIKNGKKGNDICRLTYVSGYCTFPQFLSSKINSAYEEKNVRISHDGNTLYFSSNRKGGYGGYDIYSSEKAVDGSWNCPQNIGNSINTTFNEELPVLLNDNATIFFSSDRTDGFGGYDIFSSTLDDNGWWSDAENIKSVINSNGNEYGFYVNNNESKAIVFASTFNSSNQNSTFIIIDNLFRELSQISK